MYFMNIAAGGHTCDENARVCVLSVENIFLIFERVNLYLTAISSKMSC
jgi:hypothetical protein